MDLPCSVPSYRRISWMYFSIHLLCHEKPLMQWKMTFQHRSTWGTVAPGCKASSVKVRAMSTNRWCTFHCSDLQGYGAGQRLPEDFQRLQVGRGPVHVRRQEPVWSSEQCRQPAGQRWETLCLTVLRHVFFSFYRNCLLMLDWIPMDFAVFANKLNTYKFAALPPQLSILTGGIKKQ